MSIEGIQERSPVSFSEYFLGRLDHFINGLKCHKLISILPYGKEEELTRTKKITLLAIEAFLHMAPVFACAFFVTSFPAIIGVVSILQSEVMTGLFFLSISIGISSLASTVLGTIWFINDAGSNSGRSFWDCFAGYFGRF